MSNYIGVISLVAGVASVAVSAALFVQTATPAMPMPHERLVIPQQPVVNAQDAEKFSRYGEKLEKALNRQTVVLAPDVMKVFDYQEKLLTDKAALPEEDIYRLAMVYRSGRHNYALIDDTLYKTGDLLPGGEVIKDINLSGVVISKEGATNVLVVGDYTAGPIAETRKVQRRSHRAVDDSYQTAASTQRQLDAVRNALQMLQQTEDLRKQLK